MIEIVTCRCCAMFLERVHAGNMTGPGCKCSGFWCVVSAKCVAHCPGLLDGAHICRGEERAGYAPTFTHVYQPDPAGEKKDE